MKVREIREKTTEELDRLLADGYEDLRVFRFDIATKQVKNNQAYRKTRKKIARIQTIIKERTLEAQSSK